MLLQSNLGVEPKWLLRETGNSALEADPRVPPNQKNMHSSKNEHIGHLGKKTPAKLQIKSPEIDIKKKKKEKKTEPFLQL